MMHRLSQREEHAKPDLEAVLVHYGLTPRGRKSMLSCPWHKDSTPSLSVDLNKQLFKCQSCGRGGDSWTFIQEEERTDFRGAVKVASRLDFTTREIASESESYVTSWGSRIGSKPGRKAQKGRRVFTPSWRRSL